MPILPESPFTITTEIAEIDYSKLGAMVAGATYREQADFFLFFDDALNGLSPANRSRQTEWVVDSLPEDEPELRHKVRRLFTA